MEPNMVNKTQLAFLVLAPALALANTSATEEQPEPVAIFATVNEHTISVEEYAFWLREGARDRFYHGAIPKEQIESFQREVADNIASDLLLQEEAAKRGLSVDEEAVQSRIEIKFAGRARAGRPVQPGSLEEQLLAAGIERKMIIEALRQELQGRVEQDPDGVRSYYQDNPGKFTQPARQRVSLIIKQVEPGATQEAWGESILAIQEVHRKLKIGGDFSELARTTSDHSSAVNGGDMGYLHEGMLGDNAEAAVKKLEPGEFTDPLMVLEGVAIFKLTSVAPPRKMAFRDVEERASGLWLQAEGERRWRVLIEKLRASASIQMEEQYLTLQGAAGQ
jgi:parvulin-like peptidyl-prolyl isomerase